MLTGEMINFFQVQTKTCLSFMFVVLVLLCAAHKPECDSTRSHFVHLGLFTPDKSRVGRGIWHRVENKWYFSLKNVQPCVNPEIAFAQVEPNRSPIQGWDFSTQTEIGLGRDKLNVRETNVKRSRFEKSNSSQGGPGFAPG